jgi:hypothetical protein
MRADIHRGPEPPLHPKAGYIDADPLSLSRSSLPTGGGPYIFWDNRSQIVTSNRFLPKHFVACCDGDN